jgi:hypothetical protein
MCFGMNHTHESKPEERKLPARTKPTKRTKKTKKTK